MELAEVPAILMLIGIASYAVLAGADFGAPFWALTARGEMAERIRDGGHRSMAPVWEANHVWLIFVLVICWTAYPEVFASVFSTLWIPLLLACIGIIMRAVGYVAGGVSASRAIAWLATVASFVAPFALGTVIGAVVSGRVPVGNAQGDIITSWLNPVSLAIGFLTVVSCAYLAAVYLAADARRTGDEGLAAAFRRRGLAAGVIAGGAAAAGLAVLHAEVEPVWRELTSGAGLAAVLVSGGAGILTLGLMARKLYAAARFAAALAVVAVVAGWAIAQAPDILPGLSISAAAAGREVIIGLLVSVGIGMLILIPSLSLLYGLVLGGRFDPGADGVVPEAGPGGGQGASVSAAAADGRPLGAARRGTVAAVMAVGLAGAGLSLAFDGGPGLYAGIAMLLAATVTVAILLAVSLLTAGPDRGLLR